jgi:N-acyl homoserine lactone hydrolase
MKPEIRLYLFEGGKVYMPLKNHILGADPAAMVTTPVTWFLLTHPRGNVVIDGGNAPEVAVDAAKHWGPITQMSTAIMTPDQALIPSLERLGVPLESIRWVVQSHLHLDHTGALAVIGRLPNAQVVVRRREYEWAHAPDAVAAIGYVRADFVKPGVDWFWLEDTDEGWDLFGDGVLRCWRTPGHSPGHQSFEITLPSGTSFVLPCDAASTPDHLYEKVKPGFDLDPVEAARSLRRLRYVVWRAEATVIGGHDPDNWASFRKAPEYYS